MATRRKTTAELTGSISGHLTLLEPFRKLRWRGRTAFFWKCRCVCGKEVSRLESEINRNTERGVMSSCGCKRRGASARGTSCSHWKGCGELNHTHFQQIRNRCQRINRDFTVTIEYLWDLYLKQGGKCALTGLPIAFATGAQRLKSGIEKTASLDRIDSSIGYTADNVQWIHKDVNQMKSYFPQGYFLEMCSLITKQQAYQACDSAVMAA